MYFFLNAEFFRLADLESAVNSVNHQPTPAQVPSRDELVKQINRCLNDSDVSGLVAALQSFDKECEVEVLPFAGSIYFSEPCLSISFIYFIHALTTIHPY